MAEIKVIALMEDTEYDLNKEGDIYREDIAAPYNSTDIHVKATDESGNESQKSVYLEVFSEWLPPKTDWTKDDFFNAKDYNRIIGNMVYLRSYMDRMFPKLSNVELGEKKEYTSYIYAREMNDIEKALERINAETYRFDIGETKTYKANKPTPLWSEFNRIESAMLLIYRTMIAHKEAMPRLAYKLGNQKGIK